MDAGGYDICAPQVTDPSLTEEPLLDFTSGYVLRSLDELPKQGSKEPWKLRQNYPLDLRTTAPRPARGRRDAVLARGSARRSRPQPRRSVSRDSTSG